MAKYAILMSCGHEDTVELIGKSSERERKIEYFKANGLCKECYKKKMEEESESKGLIFNATILPYINEKNGSILLNVWFDGNTRPYKDDIKSLGGYRWSERESADDYFSTSRSPLCWNKTSEADELKDEIEKAKSIGANSIVSDKGLFAMVHYQIAIDKQKEWNERNEKIKSIEKPAAPDLLKGHRWNQKIYGKAGNYSIYPDGNKVSITDEQADEIRDYLKLKEEYNKKVEKIKNA